MNNSCESKICKLKAESLNPSKWKGHHEKTDKKSFIRAINFNFLWLSGFSLFMNFGKKRNVKGRYKSGNWNDERKKKEEQKDKERNILAMESKVEVKEKI